MLDEINKYIISEDLFHAPKPTRLYTTNHYEKLEENLNKIEQIILELTGKCNLRCRYCIYNDEFKYNRSFNKKDMTIEIAKKAVDYLYEHGRKKVAVTFYGGEPLIKFELMKEIIEYSSIKLKDFDLSFSLTTNMTLITKNIADYLASVPNLNIVCSLDGPKSIHNEFRVFANNNSGSFNKAMNGLKLLSKAMDKSQIATLSINGVFAPPYSYEKVEDIYKFYDSLDFIHRDANITLSYAVENSVPKMNSYSLDGDPNPLWHWMTDKLKNSNVEEKEKLLRYTNINRPLINIHNRFIFNKSNGYYPFNGCCVPGSRRLYVSTDGKFYACERIGLSPSIGNVDDGLNIQTIKDKYVNEVSDKSIKYCSNCWGLRMCPFCYAERFDENGLRDKIHESKCEVFLESKVEELKNYYSILKANPKRLEFLKNFTLS